MTALAALRDSEGAWVFTDTAETWADSGHISAFVDKFLPLGSNCGFAFSGFGEDALATFSGLLIRKPRTFDEVTAGIIDVIAAEVSGAPFIALFVGWSASAQRVEGDIIVRHGWNEGIRKVPLREFWASLDDRPRHPAPKCVAEVVSLLCLQRRVLRASPLLPEGAQRHAVGGQLRGFRISRDGIEARTLLDFDDELDAPISLWKRGS